MESAQPVGTIAKAERLVHLLFMRTQASSHCPIPVGR